jgi:uncharacterized protein (DUF427 family)
MLERIGSKAHKIETTRPGKRVRVSARGHVLAESEDAVLLREGRLPERWYLPLQDVSGELLESEKHTRCPFKGQASYYSIRLPDGEVLEDVVWYYPEPLSGVADIADRLCFFNDRVELEIDV